jgi:hypothetical protein
VLVLTHRRLTFSWPRMNCQVVRLHFSLGQFISAFSQLCLVPIFLPLQTYTQKHRNPFIYFSIWYHQAFRLPRSIPYQTTPEQPLLRRSSSPIVSFNPSPALPTALCASEDAARVLLKKHAAPASFSGPGSDNAQC